ncbi:MAG TPA: anthrone oxygenase family protein [Pseudonocardiaceae bacterium]|jgi:hypothetical protein|nr:anthrone oxygenase family protein [Pseudonocardiaceae bacterium]
MVLKACELLNIVLSALVTGVFWGPWVGLTRSIATFEPAAFLAIGYRLNVNLAPLMTVLMPVALLTAVPTLVLSVGGRPATFVLTLIGVLLFVVALVVTLAIEVPIAARIKSWASGTALPDDWRQQRDRWAAVHVVRVATGIAGLGLLVAGAVFG